MRTCFEAGRVGTELRSGLKGVSRDGEGKDKAENATIVQTHLHTGGGGWGPKLGAQYR